MRYKEFIVLNIALFVLSLTIINCLYPAKLAAGGTTGIALNVIDISIILRAMLIIGVNSALLTILSLYLCGITINQINYKRIFV
ncbi:MAG: hypothetical protein HRT43_14575 [Campylobacteraceae bacterium]|nr:hypothetical protein [Campylobacteraceae bacterium]